MDSTDYSRVFDEAVVKILTAADINRSKGHQHEFNGVAKLKRWFHGEKTDIKTRFVQLSGGSDVLWSDESILTWYNVRENKPGREEFRMYYKGSTIFSHFNPNDLVVIVFKLATGIPEALMISAPVDSSAARNLAFLLKIEKTTNLPPVRLNAEPDMSSIGKTETVLELLSAAPVEKDNIDIKQRSKEIRDRFKFLDPSEKPDELLQKLFSAEDENGSDVLQGYYEQLAFVLIKNGLFFDVIRHEGKTQIIDLGTFDGVQRLLSVVTGECEVPSSQQRGLQFCVVKPGDGELIARMRRNGIVPVVLTDFQSIGENLTLSSFIREMRTIQGAD